MRTFADIERYLDAYGTELRARREGKRWRATLVIRGPIYDELSMDADDLDGAVNSAIEAHRATTVRH